MLLAGTEVEHDHVVALVQSALAEDFAWGPDVTTQATLPATARGTAHIVSHATGIVAGLGVAVATIESLSITTGDPSPIPLEIHPLVRDRDEVRPGERLLQLTGQTRLLLTAERTMLNLLCQLSGVATETARWVRALNDTSNGRPPVVVRDTRKTVPGLRVLQKYAVRCGGGVNLRMGLGDAALIKDNHIAAAGSITAALQAVRAHAPGISIEVECDTIEQVTEAIDAGANLILLDNMDIHDLEQAVALARPHNITLEASGGLTLDRAADIAATGIDYVALGALTHSAPALDIGLDIDP
jgi:nicotinate-nucleotide pyrophosphorylase (carboxylating)